MKKRIWLLMGVISLVLSGCGGSESASSYGDMGSKSATSYNTGFSDISEMESAAETPAAAPNENQISESVLKSRKLIKTVSLDTETEELDQLLNQIERNVNELGGYVEDFTTSVFETQRHANITARVPVEKLDQFVDNVAEISNITYRRESVEDVTLTYVDLQSHKEMLKAEEQRLLELMKQAETMEDIIALESRMTDVRYQLESMESQLRTFDNQINYSTITITVSEVEKLTQTGQMQTGQKIATGFINNVGRIIKGMKAIGVGFLINLPFFILFVIIVLIIVGIIKAVLAIRKTKRTQLPQDRK